MPRSLPVMDGSTCVNSVTGAQCLPTFHGIGERGASGMALVETFVIPLPILPSWYDLDYCRTFTICSSNKQIDRFSQLAS